MNASEYTRLRAAYLADSGAALIELERAITAKVLEGLLEHAAKIKYDFDLAYDLLGYWEEYAPLQRGHKPRGEAFPWGEVGEKVLEAYLYRMSGSLFPSVSYPGIPYGHDVRFLTESAFVQIDAKSTGPTDNQNEVVSSPNQVTGDGILDGTKITNTTQSIKGTISTRDFRPELSPFVLLGNKAYPVATLYIKVVYSVKSRGHQPLERLELICVPNGLLMLDGPKLGATRGLLIPGKDEVHVARKRVRIRLEPLSRIAEWRCVKIEYQANGFTVKTRAGNPVPFMAGK